MEQTGLKKSIINVGIWLSAIMRALSGCMSFIQVKRMPCSPAKTIEAPSFNLIPFVLYFPQWDSLSYLRNVFYKPQDIFPIGLPVGEPIGPEKPDAHCLARRE